MAPKAVVVQLRPGITQASLPDHRKAVQGVQYTLDWHTFTKISNGALENVIEVVSIVNTGGVIWMTDNGNAIVDPQTILSTVGTKTPSNIIGGQAFQGFDGPEYGTLTNTSGVITNAGGNIPVGSVAIGTQDERWMLVQNIAQYDGTGYAISAGDVCVWCNSFASGSPTPSIGEQARTVTNQRPAYATNPWAIQTFPTDNFAGVAVAAIPAGEYGWIQIEGECDTVNTSATITAGSPVSVDESNPGKAVSSAGLSTLTDSTDAQTLTFTGVSSGTFTLTFGGNTTSAITFSNNASTLASNTQTQLRTLAGASAATVSGSGSGPWVLSISIPGAETPVTGTFSGLTGPLVTETGSPGTSITLTESGDPTGGSFAFHGSQGTVVVAGGGSEALTVTGSPGVTAGTFTLTDTAGTSGSIAYNATGTAIAIAMNAIAGQTVVWTATNGAVLLNSGTPLTFTTTGNDALAVGTYSGYVFTASDIAWNASAAAIETAINTAAGAGTVTGATGGALNSAPVVLTFAHSQTVTTTSTALTPDVEAVFSGEVVTQTIALSSIVEGGTFGLVVGNYITTDIAWNAPAVEVGVALKQVPGVPTGIAESGGPLPSTVTITWPAGYAGPYITAIVDENLVYDASGQVFGTALTTDSGASTVGVYIRVNRTKTPYMRQLSQFSR